MARSELSEEFRKNRIVIAHFMSKDQKEILEELGVSKYPEIRFWNDGAQVTYDGKEYSQSEIWSFIQRNIGKDAVYLDNYKELQITETPKIVSFTSQIG